MTMPRYEETDFPPDIEVLVAASNWCLAPSPQGWKRLRDAVAAGHAMPADMAPVLDAIEVVRGLCDGHRLNGEAQAARERLSTIVERVAHDRRKANDIRRGGKVAPRISPAKAPAAQRMPAEEIPEDAPGQWWQR